MSKKLYSVTVKGREKVWGFPTMLDPNHIADYRADGLEVDEILNIIPVWVVRLGLLRPWCFLQDIFNFKNPFRSNNPFR